VLFALDIFLLVGYSTFDTTHSPAATTNIHHNSGRGDGGAGGALAPPLFAKMKFAHVYFTVLR